MLAALSLVFLILKFFIIRLIKNKKQSKPQAKSNEQMYYLEKEQLEIVRLFDKLSDENKAKIKSEMYQMKK